MPSLASLGTRDTQYKKVHIHKTFIGIKMVLGKEKRHFHGKSVTIVLFHRVTGFGMELAYVWVTEIIGKQNFMTWCK